MNQQKSGILSIALLGLLLALLGCQQTPSVPEVTPNRSVPKPKKFPVPKATPPDQALIERSWKGQPSSLFKAKMQRRTQMQNYLIRGQFSDLEAMEKSMHAWPGDDFFQHRLEDFYVGCTRKKELHTQQWLKDSPTAHAAHIATARIQVKKIYGVLGKQTPPEVDAKTRAAIEELVTAAQEHLKGADFTGCPAYHTTKLELALLSGAPWEEIKTLLKESDKTLPGYLPAYAQAAVHQLPGWYLPSDLKGESPQDHWMIVAQMLPAPQGVEESVWEQARLATLMHHMYNLDSFNVSRRIGWAWPVFQRSFDAVRSLIPDSLHALNRYAYSANYMKDTAMVNELLPVLGLNWDRGYWRDYKGWASARSTVKQEGQPGSFPHPVGADMTFPVPERLQLQFLQREIGGLFLRARFSELEAMGADILKSKKQSPSGYELRDIFFSGIFLTDQDEVINWEEAFALNRAWQQAYPESSLAKVSEAGLWSNYAWAARGTGFMSEVSKEDYKKFGDRLEKSNRIFEKLLEDSKDAVLLTYLASNYLAGPGPNEKGFEALEQAFELEPLNQSVIRVASNYTLPRWNGKPGDLGELMKRINERGPAEMGTAGSAYVVSASIWARGEKLYETDISWKETKKAYQDLLKHRNTTRIRNFYALAACYAKDRATAKEQFSLIGEAWDADIFYSLDKFRALKQWSRGG